MITNDKSNSIPFNRPFMPPMDEFEHYVMEIWERRWLTNDGPLVRELEEKLRQRLGLEHLLFVSSGTIALQLAIKALDLKGEVLTTPFSFVATTSSVVWEGCTPVFADIDPDTLNLDPERIEEAISPNTTAILATHIFGNPCDVDAIARIADKHQLKVIYDAAHCFGTTYKGQSVFNYGDISAASFHATKVFQTVEGGAVVTNDPDISERIEFMRNFGHDGPGKFNGVGINGKNSEFHAAMGLCNLIYIDRLLEVRKTQCRYYDQLLGELICRKPRILPDSKINHAYYPLIFQNESARLEMQTALEAANIFPRRYFYPSLSRLDYVKRQAVPVSEDIASRILCLPLYHELREEDQERIAGVMLEVQDRCLVNSL